MNRSPESPAPRLSFSRPRSGRGPAARKLRMTVESLERRDAPAPALGEHVHPVLTIQIGDDFVTIPSDVGITGERAYDPHTHDDTGTLHIGEGGVAGLDPPGSAARLTTLKDFFDVWRTTNVGTARNNPNAFFSSTQLLDKMADATHAVFMTVNGVANTQYENYTPDDLEEVVLSYREVVNQAPIANAQTLSAKQGARTAITLTGDDGNSEGVIQTLRYRIQNLPANGTLRDSAGNTLAAGAELTNPSLTYTSNANFSGTDRFSFAVVDNGGTANGGDDTSDPTEITMNVADSGANNPPTPTASSVPVAMDGSATFQLSGDDGDPNATQALTFRARTLPTHGTLRDSAGNIVTTNAALPSASLTYSPNAGFTGVDMFTFDVMDDGAGRTGGPLTSTGTATVQFNVVQLADPAGVVYEDLNDNGLQDDGEAGIGGVLIELTGVDFAGNDVYMSQRTADDGTYRFDTLWPGVYAVHETQPDGYLDGRETLGNLGGTVRDDAFADIVLGPGEIGEHYNFGERPM